VPLTPWPEENIKKKNRKYGITRRGQIILSISYVTLFAYSYLFAYSTPEMKISNDILFRDRDQC
jgi:hypothetical protein